MEHAGRGGGGGAAASAGGAGHCGQAQQEGTAAQGCPQGAQQGAAAHGRPGRLCAALHTCFDWLAWLQAKRRKFVVWRDEAPATDSAAAALCDVRVLAGLGPPRQATGHSFAEQARPSPIVLLVLFCWHAPTQRPRGAVRHLLMLLYCGCRLSSTSRPRGLSFRALLLGGGPPA